MRTKPTTLRSHYLPRRPPVPVREVSNQFWPQPGDDIVIRVRDVGPRNSSPVDARVRRAAKILLRSLQLRTIAITTIECDSTAFTGAGLFKTSTDNAA